MKKHLTHIFRDTVFYGAIGTASKFAAIFVTPIVVRAFDAADYGAVDALRIMGLVLSGIALFALEQAAARNIIIEDDVYKKKEVAGRALVTAFITTLFVIVVTMLFADALAVWLLGAASSDVVSSIYLLALAIPGAVCNAFALMLLRWYFRRKEYAFCAVGGTMLHLVTTLFFVVYLGFGIKGVFFAQLLASIFPILILTYYCRQYIIIRFQAPGWSIVKFAFPLSLMAQLGNMQPMIERFLIIRLIGLEGLGFFSVAQAAAKVGKFPADSIYTSWFPYYSKIFRDRSVKVLERSMIICYFIMCAVWVAMIHYFSDRLISVFAGTGYSFAAQLLPIILSGYLLEVGASIIGIKVLLVGKTGRWAALYFFQGLVFIGLSVVLLSENMGLIGVAYAFLCSRIAYFLAAYAQTFLVEREFQLLAKGID